MSENTPSPERRSFRIGLVFGIVALALGLWLFLDAQGVGLPALSSYWPLFMVLAGIATLIDYLVFSRRPGSLGQTVFWWTLAALCFSITLGYAGLRNLLDWLPGLPTIVGLSFLAAWLASRRKESGLLVPGLLFLVLGLIGFMARFERLREILPSVQEVWAAALLIVGGFLLWRIWRQRRS